MTSLEALATAPVQGRIVYFHHQMSTAEGYGAASELRSFGPAKAAERGAVATMVRSAASASLRTPHTGVVVFGAGKRAIPAVAIATEDADALHRWLGAGPVRVRLVLGCKTGANVPSANVIAEIRGRERPEEIVLVGAHLDSWDLAVGAQDDGTGVAMVVEAARLIARIRPAPRRTLRFVLFMNEENGGAGAKAYAEAHAAEVHVAALETDSGAGRPLWVGVRGGEGAESFLGPLLGPLAAVGVEPGAAEDRTLRSGPPSPGQKAWAPNGSPLAGSDALLRRPPFGGGHGRPHRPGRARAVVRGDRLADLGAGRRDTALSLRRPSNPRRRSTDFSVAHRGRRAEHIVRSRDARLPSPMCPFDTLS